MTDDSQDFAHDYIEIAADIVSAYVSNNSLPASELPSILNSVHAAISGLAGGGVAAAPKDEIEKASPAQIKKSITPDGLISFEDGKSYKTLKRHLTIRGLSPETYRAKYGLPADYPMTAASYSAQRSALAHQLGLGQKRNGASKAAAAAAPRAETVSRASAPSDAPATEKKRAGRPRKAIAA